MASRLTAATSTPDAMVRRRSSAASQSQPLKQPKSLALQGPDEYPTPDPAFTKRGQRIQLRHLRSTGDERDIDHARGVRSGNIKRGFSVMFCQQLIESERDDICRDSRLRRPRSNRSPPRATNQPTNGLFGRPNGSHGSGYPIRPGEPMYASAESRLNMRWCRVGFCRIP